MTIFTLDPGARRTARYLAAAALCVYLTTAGGSLTSVDAVMTFEVTKSLVTGGNTSFDHPGLNHHQGTDGRFYSPFGIGQSLFNVPFYLGARTAAHTLGLHLGKPDTLEKAGVALGSAVSCAGIAWVLCLFVLRLTGSVPVARVITLACAFGTLLWPYSKFGFNQPLTALCLTAGVYATFVGVRSGRDRLVFAGGAWLAGAFLTRHEMAVAALLVGGWVAIDSAADGRAPARAILMFVAPFAMAAAFWLLHNHSRFGDMFDTGNLGSDPVEDQNFTFGAGTVVGMAGLLFSPGRSVFLYVPLAVAAVPGLVGLGRRDRSLARLVIALWVCFLSLYGSLHYWDGLRGYGPRYLVALLPLLMLGLVPWLTTAHRRWRPPLLVLLWVSGMVQLPGVLVDFSKVSVEHAAERGEYTRDDKVYDPRQSALVLNARAAARAVPANVANLLHGERPAGVTEPAAEDDTGFSQRFAFSLDFWWLYLYYFGVIRAAVAGMVAALLMLGAVICLTNAWRHEAAHEPGSVPC